MEYFPYSDSDELKFVNPQNDTLRLKIVNKWISDSYSFKQNCKCSCEATAGFDAEDINNCSIRIEGRIFYYNDNSTSILSCNFYDNPLRNDCFEINKNIENPYSNQSKMFFGDTIVMNKDSYYRVEKVIIIKGKGLVEFWDSKNNCHWIIHE